MDTNTIPDKQKQIFLLESLLNEAKKIKDGLENFKAHNGYLVLDGLKGKYLNWLKKASDSTGKEYKSLVPSRNIPDGATLNILQEKAAMLGDVVSVEEDIHDKIINIKKQFQKGSVLVKELIIKELTADKELKAMFRNLLDNKIGAMARHITEYLKAQQDKGLLKSFINYSSGDLEHVKKTYESQIKRKLRAVLAKSLAEKDTGDEFDIAYLEAKDDLIELDKAKVVIKQEVSKKPSGPEVEKAEYEILLSGKKKRFISSEKAEAIRNKKGTGRGIFIDDERKEVFFNKKIIDEFQGQMYSMLRHFIMNEGVGGNTLSLYAEIWGNDIAAESNIENAVHQAVRRFRAMIKKNGMGDVPEISKSAYSASKTYILKPRPKYCVLRRIEKENKE